MAKTEEELKLEAKTNLLSGVDNIKLAIEYLLGLQDKQAQMMQKMDKDLRSRNYIVDKMAREAGERDTLVKNLQQKIKDLENKSCDHEDKLFGINTDIESFKMNYQIFQRSMQDLRDSRDGAGLADRIAKNERDIKDLMDQVEKANRPVFAGKDGADAGEIDQMLENWKKEMHSMFARREDVESLEDRIKQLEHYCKQLNDNLTDTTTTVNDNKTEIDKLKKLLDSDMFDSEIANLTEAVKNAGGDVSKVVASPSSNLRTKDTKQIKDMLAKFPYLEKTIQKLQKKLAEAATKKELDQLERDIKDTYEGQLKKILDDLKSLKDLLDHLSRDIDFLKTNLLSGVDNIKLAIEYLLGLQDKQAQMMQKMDKDLRSRNYIVDKMAREAGERDTLVKNLQQKIKDLENKSCDHEDKLFGINTDIESFKMNYQIFQRSMQNLRDSRDGAGLADRIAKNERDIKDLMDQVEKANRPVFAGKDGADAGEIDQMLENWKKEMHSMFARREDVESLEDRIKQLEHDCKQLNDNLTDTTTTVNDNKTEIEKLKKLLDGKLDSDMFDSEIANLTEAVKNAGDDVSKVVASPSSNLSTKDTKQIKDMLAKFPDFEKAIQELQKKLTDAATKKELDQLERDIKDTYEGQLKKISDDLKSLKDLLDHLSRNIDFLKASGGSGGSGANNSGASPDINIQITNKIEKLEVKLGNLENELSSLRRSKPQTVTMPTQNMPTGVDESRVEKLEKDLSRLHDDFKGLNNEIIKEIKNHQDQINGKVDYGQLEEVKDDLLGRIEDLMRGLKQFADRSETKKALKNLEKQLKNLYDLVMSRLQGGGADEDDAMFSKKPLGGFSCASCEKNLINLSNKPPDYYSWNKLPLRDPAERIARVGQGFSKMLSSMKPETASRFQGVSSKYNQQYFENPDHTAQPVRTQQNFYQGNDEYKRPESAGMGEK